MKLITSTLFALTALVVSSLAADNYPVFHTNNVILFQGDSITDGGRQRTGQDYNHIMGQSYAYIIAAQIGAEHPERNLNFINRGIGGNTVTDLAARWQKDTLDLKPDILSILIGINDTLGSKQTIEQYEQTYDHLLAEMVAALPHTKIVLCEPFILPVGKREPNYKAERAEVEKRQEILARLAAKYHLPIVRYQAAYDVACGKSAPDHWLWDGVHPTYAGHYLLVQEWMKTVNQFWPNG
jgi:lysophospholipase L1-like esterase